MELKGTKTEKNLKDAFAVESKLGNKYEFFAEIAKKEGYKQIANIFKQTAQNESAHAKIWYEMLEKIGTTEENLATSKDDENFEWTNQYSKFAKEAKDEGFLDIAKKFDDVGKIEKVHEENFKRLLKNVETKKVFEKTEESIWICTNCGNVIMGKKVPDTCSVCSYPKSNFEIKAQNY